jgi:hypothetical protein
MFKTKMMHFGYKMRLAPAFPESLLKMVAARDRSKTVT